MTCSRATTAAGLVEAETESSGIKRNKLAFALGYSKRCSVFIGGSHAAGAPLRLHAGEACKQPFGPDAVNAD